MGFGSLIFTLRTIAFAGPLLRLPPETALALPLAKRARDLPIGLPTLLLWQVNEMRNVAGPGEQAL